MVDKTIKKTNGVNKAAVLLLSLGEETSAKVFKLMDPREVGIVGQEMMKIDMVPQLQVNAILSEFNQSVGSGGIRALPVEQVKRLIKDAVGDGSGVIIPGESTRGIDNLKWLDARTIADLIQDEHPQVIALILSFLESQKASEVLSSIKENDLRTEIIQRISRLEDIHPTVLFELSQNLEKQLEGNKSSTASKIGGLQLAANLINFLSASVETDLMTKLTEIDEKLANDIQELMFVFDDLVKVDGKAIQSILKEVKPDQIALALKAADDAVKQKIFSNMSKRAAEMLQDDLEAMGPVRISDAEAAQKEILAAARRLADEGKILLSVRGDEGLV